MLLPYVLVDDGKKQPVPGAVSIFIRGGFAVSCELHQQFTHYRDLT